MILIGLFALFASMMLVKHLPTAIRVLRRRGPDEGVPGMVALVTVLLAFAILGTAAVQALHAVRGR